MDNCHKGLLEVIKNDEQFTFLREKYRDEINMLENLNNKLTTLAYHRRILFTDFFLQSLIMCEYLKSRCPYGTGILE